MPLGDSNPGNNPSMLDAEEPGKEVCFDTIKHCNRRGQLPEDILPLYADLLPILRYGTGIFPQEIRAKLSTLSSLELPPSVLVRGLRRPKPDPKTGGNRPGQDVTQAVQGEAFFDGLPLSVLFSGTAEGASVESRIENAEFYKLRAIVERAKECSKLIRGADAWKSKVDEPLLELAFSRHHKGVTLENATSARLIPSFVPSRVLNRPVPAEIARGRTVDFVVSPTISPDSKLGSAIHAKLVSLEQDTPGSSWAHPTLNPTDYPPLAWSPVAMAVGVGINPSDPTPFLPPPESRPPPIPWEEWCNRPSFWESYRKQLWAGAIRTTDVEQQLRLWVVAWHKRMEMLGIGGRQGPALPTLILINVQDHNWFLSFAVDRLDKIEILGGSELIGGTNTLVGVYKLVTVLRMLAGWIDTTFRSWVEKTFGPQATIALAQAAETALVQAEAEAGSGADADADAEAEADAEE
ncbi:hypothetical protein VTJ49DRAFT_3300 [Mycothermus thermophilus]|uniref:PD-(D/E)XK nuclease-like domain-containing protein n=1 Tax=Humicola insolens TaxID=85995 RepID=A0ABR3V7Y7_HUMIN